MPVAVPGLGHRQAVVPQEVILHLRDHAFAKAPLLLAFSDEERAKLPDVARAQADRPLVGTRDYGGGDRPGRDLVVHQLRGVRGGMPGGHRAHRPHRRNAPPPGADRVRVPGGGHVHAAEPGEQGRPVGDGPGPPRRLDHRAGLRDAGGRRDDRARRGVPVLGRLRGRIGGPRQKNDRGDRHPAASGRGEVRGTGPGRCTWLATAR